MDIYTFINYYQDDSRGQIDGHTLPGSAFMKSDYMDQAQKKKKYIYDMRQTYNVWDTLVYSELHVHVGLSSPVDILDNKCSLRMDRSYNLQHTMPYVIQ